MKISVQLDKNLKETEIIIKTAEMNDRVNEIVEQLSDEKPRIIVGFIDGVVRIINEQSIIRIYSANKKIYAVTAEHEYMLKIPLYEVIDRLDKNQFVRISNTDIVNLKKVLSFDLNFIGTICIRLSNGDVTYVSRRNVSNIKKTLGIRGK